MIQKAELRARFKALREAISQNRRLEASKSILEDIEAIPAKRVLSFMPFGSELDLKPLNRLLASQGRLVLPRRAGMSLDLFLVENLDEQLEEVGIHEPIPTVCQKVMPSTIDLVLVPGLAFDVDHFRLGYGKGHYDQLLPRIKGLTIGVGFQEQLSAAPLPRDPWDVSLQKILLR